MSPLMRFEPYRNTTRTAENQTSFRLGSPAASAASRTGFHGQVMKPEHEDGWSCWLEWQAITLELEHCSGR